MSTFCFCIDWRRKGREMLSLCLQIHTAQKNCPFQVVSDNTTLGHKPPTEWWLKSFPIPQSLCQTGPYPYMHRKGSLPSTLPSLALPSRDQRLPHVMWASEEHQQRNTGEQETISNLTRQDQKPAFYIIKAKSIIDTFKSWFKFNQIL